MLSSIGRIRAIKGSHESSELVVVGIGASAGGVEAFKNFIYEIPAETGIAFVFIQHLDPNYESVLAELLAKEIHIPVIQISDNLEIKANYLYLYPSDHDVQIENKIFKLIPREMDGNIHLPVNSFFNKLAEVFKENAIGVILSGSASDGALGLKKIKETGGLTFVQEPLTAKYDSMPRKAMSTVEVDFILPPDEIAREIVAAVKSTFYSPREKIKENTEGLNVFDKLFKVLYHFSGIDFSNYRSNTLTRRISKRMLMLKINEIKDYINFVEKNDQEKEALFNDMLINVTGFFRDPEIFEALKKTVFPSIVKDHSNIRLWIPGCSSGEEVYSIAITLLEYLGENRRNYNIQIFATDVSERVIDKARIGAYPNKISDEISSDLLSKYFYKIIEGYQINKNIRDLCVFARQDIIKDPPFSKINLISCRNLLIYLNQEAQKKLINTFHFSLNPSGYLMLGNSESIGSHADLFSLVNKKNKIYVKKQTFNKPTMEFTLSEKVERVVKKSHLQYQAGFDIIKEADKIIMNAYTPSGVLVNENMNIVQFRGDTSKLFKPTPGVASLNLFKMIREELTFELRTAIHKAKKTEKNVKKTGVEINLNGETNTINLEVVPISQTGNSKERYYLILFDDKNYISLTEAPFYKGEKVTSNDVKFKKLQEELIVSKEYLQSIIDDREATNEELRSSLEELQSSHEELQSINEELETAKEELQSTNEELTTVNEELQNRNDELNHLNNDLLNLLGSVHIPIIMLGSDLKIRRFTPMAQKILHLIPTDIGRPLSDLRINVKVENIEMLINEVIETLEIKEVEVQDLNNQWFSMRIRPYKTITNKIDGVVIAFIDINDMKLNTLKGGNENTIKE